MAEKKTKLADNKIRSTNASVEGFLNSITPEQEREDSFVLLEMMKKASRERPYCGAIPSSVSVSKDTKAHPPAANPTGCG